MENQDLIEILNYIDPSQISYNDWISCGMVLKDAGYPCSVWDQWSSRDTVRYHGSSGECFKKWDSFYGSSRPVKSGTIVQLAMEQGWSPYPKDADYEIGWDSVIGGKDEKVVIDAGWLESREVQAPEQWHPVEHLVRYLETLFEAGENVGYVTDCWEKNGKYMPTKGHWDRTAGELIEQLNKCGGDIGAVLGDYKEEAGAWIRFNPMDGVGCKNDNVTDYRFALVESDKMEIDRQNAILRELALPIACLVHSGNKSLHAIVRIDAAGYDEYRKRVDYLYDVCKKNGLTVDTQNKNPSRLSRMPGVLRNGHKQFLVDANIGKGSWKEWQEWIESVNDDLPDPENMADVWDNLPKLSDPLIDGVLRQGHKMLLAGPSKAGKSYALIELICAIAEGNQWLNWTCTKGRVLYVNLELDRASCLHRFRDVYEALGWPAQNLNNIDIWNLRGRSIPMDKLAPKLIRRAAKKNYLAIVIDPIYKVITGDENSADQMAHFCNQFDRVCTELGCAVIYCHHHSKGTQGQKRSMDRASGSGVFARDPDALLDLIELETTEALMKQEENKAICKACIAALEAHKKGWQDEVSQDDQCSQLQMLLACEHLLKPVEWQNLHTQITLLKKANKTRTAWRIEGTLREFPKFDPVNLWFDYPVHHVDMAGSLKDVDANGETLPWKKATLKLREGAKSKAENKRLTFENAVATCNFGQPPTLKMLAEALAASERTVRDWIKIFGYSIDRNTGEVVLKSEKD